MATLICYDESPSAQHSLRAAAGALGNSPAVLLHVWNPPERVLADAFGLRDDDHDPSYEQLEELVKQRADEVLATGQTLAQHLGVTVTVRQERNRSTIWKTILEVADESTPTSSSPAPTATPPCSQGSWAASPMPWCTTPSEPCSRFRPAPHDA